MTGIAALAVMSIPGTATALPKTGNGAPGAESIFDVLVAALAPMASDQTSGPAPPAPQATPPLPMVASDAATQPAIFPDAIASLGTALGDPNPLSQMLPSAPQSNPAKPDTALSSPIFADPAAQILPQDEIVAPAQPRPARSERAGASPPTNKDTANDSLVALLMVLPQLPPAVAVPSVSANPSAVEDVTIGNAVKNTSPNSLPGVVANAIPQKDLLNAAGETIPGNSTEQPAKANPGAIPAAAAMPFVLPQAGDSPAPVALKGAPSPAAEKPTTNSADRRGQSETVARPSKTMTSTAVAQADNAAPLTPSVDSSPMAERTQSNSRGRSEPAAHPSQDVASIAVPRPDNLVALPASNGYVAPATSNHAPLELSGIAAANAPSAGAPQSADAPMRLALSAPGVVADPASMDALALRIAAKSADGESQFQIRLDPPSLGRIEIHLNMDSQGNAQAQLSADRPQTLEALQRDASSLERALKDAGLDLPGGLSFSLKGDGKSGGAWRDSQNSGRSRAIQIDAVDAANKAAAISGLASMGQPWGAASTRLDIRV